METNRRIIFGKELLLVPTFWPVIFFSFFAGRVFFVTPENSRSLGGKQKDDVIFTLRKLNFG